MSDGAKEVLSSHTCASRFGVSCLNCSAHGTCSGSLPAGGEPDRAGDDVGAGRGRRSDRELHAPRPAGADEEVARRDGEVQRLGVALGDHADRKLQTPRRDVANGDPVLVACQ